MAGLVATTMTSTRFTRFSRQGALLRFYYLYVTFIFSEQQNFFFFFLGLVGCLERLRGGGGAGCVQARKVFRPIWESFTCIFHLHNELGNQ